METLPLHPDTIPTETPQKIAWVVRGAIGLCNNPKLAINADLDRIRGAFEILLNDMHLLQQVAGRNHCTMPPCHAEVLRSPQGSPLGRSLEASHEQSIDQFEALLKDSLKIVREEEEKEEEMHRKGFTVKLLVVQDYIAHLRNILSRNGDSHLLEEK